MLHEYVSVNIDADLFTGYGSVVTVRAGSMTYTPHDRNNNMLYIVSSGTMKQTYYTASGNEITVRLLVDGAIFGHSSLFAIESQCYVSAITECEVIALSQVDLQRAILSNPSLGLSLLKSLVLAVNQYETKHAEFINCPHKEKIAKLLVRLAVASGSNIIRLTQFDIMELCAIRTQSDVSLILASLPVCVSRGKIEIQDMMCLNSIARLD